MPTIEVLDHEETVEALSGRKYGDEVLAKITESLLGVVDTDNSVYVEGLGESQLNNLRTRMYRRDVRIKAIKIARQGKRGHVLTATTVVPA